MRCIQATKSFPSTVISARMLSSRGLDLFSERKTYSRAKESCTYRVSKGMRAVLSVVSTCNESACWTCAGLDTKKKERNNKSHLASIQISLPLILFFRIITLPSYDFFVQINDKYDKPAIALPMVRNGSRLCEIPRRGMGQNRNRRKGIVGGINC